MADKLKLKIHSCFIYTVYTELEGICTFFFLKKLMLYIEALFWEIRELA